MRPEFSDRVPRTEYSAESHWELAAQVTGIPVTRQSPDSEKGRASNAFKRARNYDMIWNVLVHRNYMHGKTASMGHAVYAAGGRTATITSARRSTTRRKCSGWTPGAVRISRPGTDDAGIQRTLKCERK